MEGDCTSQDQVLPRRNPTVKVVIVILYKVAVITNVTLVYSSMDSAHHDTINLNVSEERKEKKDGMGDPELKAHVSSSANRYIGLVAEKSKHRSRSCSSFPELWIRCLVSGLDGRC